MFRTLVKADVVKSDELTLSVRYFEIQTIRGARRYSAEIVIGPDDCVILDDDSLWNLEARASRLLPASIYSRLLAGRATAA
jgi:hypothetical protein